MWNSYEIILPHLHAAVIHFPIALLFVASAAALLYLLGFGRASWRMPIWIGIVLGWIAVAPAILSGLLAQSVLPPQAPYRATLNWHISTGLALAVVYALVLYRRWLRRPRRKQTTESSATDQDFLDMRKERPWLLALLVIGLLLLISTGWNGGRLVYEWGVNVATGS